MKTRSQGPPDPQSELVDTISKVTMASISNTPVFHYGDDPDLFFFKLDAYIKSTKKDSAEVYKS